MGLSFRVTRVSFPKPAMSDKREKEDPNKLLDSRRRRLSTKEYSPRFKNNRKHCKKTKTDAHVSARFLGECGESRQVTKISRSRLEKFVSNVKINVCIKDKMECELSSNISCHYSALFL